MKDFWFEGVKRVWKWNKAVTIILIVVGLTVILEAAQSGFLGDSAYRGAARVVPWKPWFAPKQATTAIYKLRKQGSSEFAFMTKGDKCQVGSEISITYARTGDGWIAAVGYNLLQGYYPLTAHGLTAVEINKNIKYEIRFSMTSAAGEEMIFIIGSNKPFDTKRDFDPVLRDRRHIGKGGEPDFAGSLSGEFDVAPVMTCFSDSKTGRRP